MPTEPPPETLPRELGIFTLRRLLGTGSFGAVYEAFNRAEQRLVALKLLKPERQPDEEAMRRFHKEAQAAARLTSERCVFVYGVHELDGMPAIEMELVTGGTLQQRLAGGEPVPLAEALDLAVQLLEGVEAAHRAGVVHRDLKPGNCFLTESGRLKVGDFGLARLLLVEDATLTRTGQFLGTPLFASPEQVRGEAIDERTDVYAAAATIYNLLAGRPVHTARTYEELIGKVLTQEPVPLDRLRADCPRRLAAVVHRALSKDPSKRPPSCAALREQLLACRLGQAEPAGVAARTLALAIDFLLAGLIMGLLGAASDGELVEHGVVFAYLLVGLAFFAATPGQWLLGLRVAADDGREARLANLALRVLAFPILPNAVYVTCSWACRLCGHDIEDDPGSWVLWVGAMMMPALSLRRGQPFVGWHERWSKTRTVVARHGGAEPPFVPVTALAKPTDAVLAPDSRLIVRGMLARTRAGSLLLCRDPVLGRDVLLAPHVEARSDLESMRERTESLRVVRRLAGPAPWVVYEHPGGAPLAAYEGRGAPVPWRAARRLLLETLDVVRRLDAEHGVDRLWIDGVGRMRVLDFPCWLADAVPPPRMPPSEPPLATVARILFGCRRTDAGRPAPLGLPRHADPIVDRVFAGGCEGPALLRLRADLAAAQDRATVVEPRATLRHLVLSLALPLAIALAGRPWQEPQFADQCVAFALGAVGQAGTTTGPFEAYFDAGSGAVVRYTEVEHAAALTLVAEAAGRGDLQPDPEPAVVALVAGAVTRFPAATLTATRVAAARQALEPLRPAMKLHAMGGKCGSWRTMFVMLACLAGASGVLALCLGNQPSWAVVGVAFRNRHGRAAGRLRVVLRTLLAWLPWLTIAALGWGWWAMRLSEASLTFRPTGGGLYLTLKALPKLLAVAALLGLPLRNQIRSALAAIGVRRKPSVDDGAPSLADFLAGTRMVVR